MKPCIQSTKHRQKSSQSKELSHWQVGIQLSKALVYIHRIADTKTERRNKEYLLILSIRDEISRKVGTQKTYNHGLRNGKLLSHEL